MYHQQSNKCESMLNRDGLFQCNLFLCKKIVDNQLKLMQHLKAHLLKNYTVECPYNKCDKEFSTIYSFKNHLNKVHRKKKILKKPVTESTKVIYKNILINEDEFIYFNNIAIFYMKLETQYRIPQSTISLIANELELMHLQISVET